MSIIVNPNTWQDNQNLTAPDLNASFKTIYQDYNGNITDENLATTAKIAENKILFSKNGHTHNGEDSYLIPKGGIVWSVSGGLFVDGSFLYAPYAILDKQRKLTACRLVIVTPPSGNSVIVDVERSTDNGANFSSLWNTTPANRPTIASGGRTAVTTNFDISDLPAGTVLRIKIKQTGSTVAGSDLTVELF